MLTGLRIYATRDGFKLAEAPEDYSSGDFLADILRATNPGASMRKWALKDGVTGRILQPNCSLSENQVESDHDLYLVLRAGATLNVDLNISAPDGKSLQCEIPSSTMASAFIAKLVQHFDLAEADSHGRRQQWILIFASDHEALDPGLSLVDNGIASKDRLYVRPLYLPDILVEVISPGGETERRRYSPERSLGEVLHDLLGKFKLPTTTDTGVKIEWQIHNWSTGQRLYLAKTLTENNVESGTKLTLKQAKEPVLGLTDQNPDYQARTFGVPGTDAVELMLGNVIDSSGPARFNKGGGPQNWSTMDRERDKMLGPENQLTANEVKTRPQLAVVQKHSDLILKIISPTRETREAEEPGDTTSITFLNDLILSFRLAKENEDGTLVQWILCRNDNGKSLDMGKTLSENGLVDGNELVIRQGVILHQIDEDVQRGGGGGKVLSSPLLVWLKESPVQLIISSLALLGIVVLIVLVHLPQRRALTVVAVRVLPNASTLSIGETLRLRSEVTGGNSGKLSWSLSPEIGSLSPDLIYSAPTSIQYRQTVRVTATSVEDSRRSGSADLTLLPPKAPAVTVSPTEVTLEPAETVQFQARLRADVGSFAQWTLDPDLGTITPDGVYTAPVHLASPQRITVTASSLSSPQAFAKATILLGSSPVSRLAPGSVTLSASQSSQFTIPRNLGGVVVWQMHPSVGSISATGLYTAPSLVPQKERVTVTAKAASGAFAGAPSAGAPSATATIELRPVTMGAITYTSNAKHQYLFRTAVTNAGNPAVLWSIEPKLGNISADGLYTAPAELLSSLTVAISATSLADPTKSTKLDVVLPASRPEVTVRINAHEPSLFGGQSEQLVATVTGANDRSVTWACSGLGNISPLGLYTAPWKIPPQGTIVRIIVTSNADSSRSAREEISLRPALGYLGPQMGTLIWNGKIGKNQTLSISSDGASIGSIDGAFPGVPITVSLTSKGSRIVTPPSQANSWKAIVIESQSKQKKITVDWRFALP